MTDEQRAVVESIRDAMADPDGVMLGGDVVILLAALDAVEAENAKAKCEIAELHDIVSAYESLTRKLTPRSLSGHRRP